MPRAKKSTKSKHKSKGTFSQAKAPAVISSMTRVIDTTLSRAEKAKRKATLTKAQALARDINKKLKGKGSVLVGDEIEDLPFRKILTGNPAIDYVSNGGLIRGRITQFWGPEQACKTTSLAAIIRHFQSLGLLCGFAPIEGFDKGWWRNIGVFIPYSKKELMRFDATKRRAAERYNEVYLESGWAPLTLVQHRAGDEALQLIYELTKSNLYDALGLDSLGAITSSRVLEEKDVSDPAEYGGEAKLFNSFQRFMQSAFNTYYDDDGEVDETGRNFNDTVVIAINQARVAIGTRAQRADKKFYPTGGQGLKHFWSQSMFFDQVSGEEQSDMVNYDGVQRRDVYAKTFRCFGNKMRGGPPDREARFTLHVKHHTHDGQSWRAGQLDTVTTVRALGVQLGVIDQAGAYYSYDDTRIKGKDNFDAALWNDPELYDRVYMRVIETAIEQSGAYDVPAV